MKLIRSYYCNVDTIQLSKNILGKKLVTNINNQITSGLIVETEAYLGLNDKASHAYKGKTSRTKVMFEQGGVAYIYLCYGLHYLFNIVCNFKNIPHAILIRAIEPIEGIEYMKKRRRHISLNKNISNGPGKLTQALGITTNLNNKSLIDNNLWIEDIGYEISDKNISSVPRIGVDYAQEDAKLPYRFYIKNNKWVSQK